MKQTSSPRGGRAGLSLWTRRMGLLPPLAPSCSPAAALSLLGFAAIAAGAVLLGIPWPALVVFAGAGLVLFAAFNEEGPEGQETDRRKAEQPYSGIYIPEDDDRPSGRIAELMERDHIRGFKDNRGEAEKLLRRLERERTDD